MTSKNEAPEARAERPTGLRWLAWSGAALGALMVSVAWLMRPAEGSNYAVVLADQSARLETIMWIGAAIGAGVPAVVWLLQLSRRTVPHGVTDDNNQPAR
jgi:hypothetical protein